MFKKLMTFSSLLALFLASTGMAQITLDASDWTFNVGEQFTYRGSNAAFNYDSYTTGSGGPTQWDFSSIPFTITATSKFINPATAPETGQFPGATHCIEVLGLNSWSFFAKSSSSVSDLGHYSFFVFGDTLKILIKYQAPALLLPFPTELNTSWNTFRNYKLGSTGPTHDSTVVRDSTFNVCNGWGSAKFGSKVVDCLRIKSAHRTISHNYTTTREIVDTNFSESYQFHGKIGATILVAIQKFETQSGFGYSANGDGSFVDQATPVEDFDGAPSLPKSFTLEQNSPNPFNPATTIRYNLERPNDVKLEIFNLLGENVFSTDFGRQTMGVHEVKWNAKSSGGHSMPSGVYFYRLTAGAESAIRKMILLK